MKPKTTNIQKISLQKFTTTMLAGICSHSLHIISQGGLKKITSNLTGDFVNQFPFQKGVSLFRFEGIFSNIIGH